MQEEFENQGNIQDKLANFLGSLPENYSVLEEQVDVELQMEYFKKARKENRKIEDNEIPEKKETLYKEETSLDDKKLILLQLAACENPEAYRVIEDYKKEMKEKDEILFQWASIALHESRMNLESSLLEQSQVFISTGLGGKGKKLRYFVVFILKDENNFSETQQKLIKSEIEFAFKEINGELEELNFDENFATFTCLLPIEIDIKRTFQNIVDECNSLGEFLSNNFIVTNVKKMTKDEITDFLNKSDGSEDDEINEIDYI